MFTCKVTIFVFNNAIHREKINDSEFRLSLIASAIAVIITRMKILFSETLFYEDNIFNRT